MNIEEFQNYALSKMHVEESFPFDEVTLAYKVKGKIFAITGLNSDEFTVNLKCEPEQAIQWRDRYPEVQPGWHMNKKHWNTVSFEGNLPDALLKQMIDHSYQMVVSSLPKKDRF